MLRRAPRAPDEPMPSPVPDLIVRPAATPDDWRAVRDLCCRTGAAGNPIEARRWPFFAELWIGAYQRLVPGWTLVAEADGEIVGYLTGCPDTRWLRQRRVLGVTLPLLLAIATRRYVWNGDTRRFVRRSLGWDRGPEERLRATLPASLERDYPAHLHMNVEASRRNLGIGRRLLERHLTDLRARRVAGLHLFCGAEARGFYARAGFEEVGRIEVRPGVLVHALARRVAPNVPG